MRKWMISICLFLVPVWALAGEGQFDSKGVRICYNDGGNSQGEPVFLVHGFAVNASLQWTMPGVTKVLNDKYRVILFDNRGHGRSGRPKDESQYGLEMVHDIARLMDHLKIKKAHFVGYSMGAFLTHKFAATYPDRVKSIVLGGAGWLKEGLATDTMDEISDALRTKKSLEPLFRALQPPDAGPLDKEQIASVSKMAMLINDPLALAGVAKGMKQLKLSDDEMKHVAAPTLCIVGDRDPLAESVRLMEGARSNMKTHYIKKANHMNAFELQEFRDAIAAFLREQQ